MFNIGITRWSLVCLRFDDYHQDIDVGRWQDVLSKYNKRGLRGIIGVIPAYQGNSIDGDVLEFAIKLEDAGWELGQHGYTHENIGEGRGGLMHDDRSEFAGVPFEEQKRRILLGKELLADRGVDPTTFIPPWHEFDRNTIKALSQSGFDCLNESRRFLPRTRSGVTLVPTHPPWLTPDRLALGVVTLVSHPHLEANPLRNAELVQGYEARLKTPREIVDWWSNSHELEKWAYWTN